MTRIYLCRHGETESNAKHILQGHLPVRLTQKGKEQASELCNQLKDIHFDAILCSDLIRAIETAQIVAEPHHQDFLPTPLLRERDWGSLAGCLISDIQGKSFPQDVETVEDMFQRAHQFLKQTVQTYPNQTILVVAHGLLNRVILAELTGKTIKDIPPFTNAEYRILEIPTSYSHSTASQEDVAADN